MLRIYSETLPWDVLGRQDTIALLARYRLELVLAVRPWDLEALPDVARALRDAGVPLSIWPMLADDAGRWASMHNAAAFGELVVRACDLLESAGTPTRDVLFDLEPPFSQVQAITAGGPDAPRSKRGWASFAAALHRTAEQRAAFSAGTAVLAATADDLEQRGVSTSMAVWPLVALDPPLAATWQSLLGTPVDTISAAHVSVMMYTSILEGWSRGALRRRDTLALLAAATARSVNRWGARSGISVGCVGTGAFADEPVYRSPAELAEDVSIVRAAGCDRLSLFDLGGVLARPPAEAWLDAFVAGAELSPGGPHSRRVRVARTALRAATWALGRR